MDHWNYSRSSQQQGHPQAGQLGYPPGSYGSQQGAASVAAPYGSQLFSQSSFGQAYGQQILGTGGKTAGSDEYQGGAVGSAALSGGTSVNMSGLYGLDSKFSGSGYGVVGASPAAFNQKTDQLGALGQYSKSQSSFLASDGHSDALKRYSESQLLQTALRQGSAPSVLDSGVRSQSDYLSAGRNSAIASAGGGLYGAGRDLLGSTYGVSRSEAEAALLGSQVGLAARGGVGVLPYQSQTADSLGSLAGGRGILGAMYPPGAAYSSLDLASARSGISGMSDLAGIGSARYDDRLDDRMALRYDYEKRNDDRRVRERSRERDRDRERERERERSWERERERERERVRERDRARERDRVRDRERTRERERDRERELRRRERTPPRVLPAPRRDEKVGKKVSPPPPRFSSPLKPRKREYVCKIEPFSLAERERDLLSLIRRYPKLYVAADFSKVVMCWREIGSDIALNQPISFEHDAVDAEEERDAKDAAMVSAEDAEALKENIVWTVKVMLMSGASDDSLKELLSDSPSEDKPAHLHNFLRFVVLRKERSALMAVGGSWDKALDGGDPAADESSLIRTAIRCTKDATQVDLGGVSSWRRVMEVHYDRVRDNNSTYKEILVFFIPDLSGCLPTLENWKLQWKQRREARLKREASQKQEKDGKSGGSPKDTQKKDKAEKKEGKDTKEEKKDPKKEEKVERDAKKDDKKEKDVKEEKKDPKKEEKKDKDLKKEEKKEKDVKKDDKKDKDVKKEDKKEKDAKQEDKKEKDAKQEDKKEKDAKKEDKKPEGKKDRKGKVEKKDKEEKKDEAKKEEKKDDKDVKAAKGKGSDKKGKAPTEEEAPDFPGLFITSKRNKADKARAMTISLDGLLDYDERDKEESTFELSLFAEVFQEMLQFRFGSHLLEAFESLHHALQARKKEEKKRARDQKDTKAATNKKSKFSDNATPGTNTDDKVQKVDEDKKDSMKVDEPEKKDDTRPVKDIDAAMQEASLINFDELEEELQETPEVLDADVADEEGRVKEASETKKSDRKFVIDEELLKAFRYFDRNRMGFLKAEDVRRLVHILGRFLTRRWVKDLTTSALTESKSKDECIYYQKLVEKEAM